MKCKISFVTLIAMLSVANGVSVDYYHDHHSHPSHVKYVEPAHVKPVKYFQPAIAPVAPVYKHFQAAPIKYIHQEPQPIKYIHHEQQPVKYIHQEPHQAKYIHPDPHYEKYSKHVEYDEPAHYEFGYDVHDSLTGDIKSHSEKRDGHTVQGRYEVLDPDGFKRIVEYTADEHNGFNAVVTREPVVKKIYDPTVVKAVAPIPVAPVRKFFVPQHEAIVSATPKYLATPVHQKVIAPIVKQYSAPQYYAPPEHPKFFKPAFEKAAKFVKPAYEYEPHTAVKYVTANDYNRY